MGGFPVRLRFAGPALVSFLTPALAHLAARPVSSPALTVCLWDSVSTRTAMPSPPWQADDYRERGEIRGFNNERIRTAFQMGSNALSMVDLEKNLALFWIRSAEQVPFWETGAPLLSIFHFWMGQQGIQLIHAGAVGMPDGGVLLAGRGGSGKSTTALSCLDSELFFAGDDYCLLASEPVPTVYSMYSTGKKDPKDIQRLPFLISAIGNRARLDTEKAVYFLHEHFPKKILPSFPLRAIATPRLTGEPDTTFKETSPREVLTALAPSTIFQLPGAGQEALRMMRNTVRQVRCYYLNLGTDMAQIPGVIFKLLRESR